MEDEDKLLIPDLGVKENISGRLTDTDKLLRKARTVAGTAPFIPSIWGPLVKESLRVGHHPWPPSGYTPPKKKRRIPLRSRIAWWLHDLSEKFEECGFRD